MMVYHNLMMFNSEYKLNVGKTTINHPQFHRFDRWYIYINHSQSLVVYDIVLTTLDQIKIS